jgi:hypothetical protein
MSSLHPIPDLKQRVPSIEPPPDITYDGDGGGTFAKGSKNYVLVSRALLLKTNEEKDSIFQPSKLEAKSKFQFPQHNALDNVQGQFSCYLDMEVLCALQVNDHVIREMGNDTREATAFWRMQFYCCIWWSGLDSLRLMIPPCRRLRCIESLWVV